MNVTDAVKEIMIKGEFSSMVASEAISRLNNLQTMIDTITQEFMEGHKEAAQAEAERFIKVAEYGLTRNEETLHFGGNLEEKRIAKVRDILKRASSVYSFISAAFMMAAEIEVDSNVMLQVGLTEDAGYVLPF